MPTHLHLKMIMQDRSVSSEVFFSCILEIFKAKSVLVNAKRVVVRVII